MIFFYCFIHVVTLRRIHIIGSKTSTLRWNSPALASYWQRWLLTSLRANLVRLEHMVYLQAEIQSTTNSEKNPPQPLRQDSHQWRPLSIYASITCANQWDGIYAHTNTAAKGMESSSLYIQLSNILYETYTCNTCYCQRDVTYKCNNMLVSMMPRLQLKLQIPVFLRKTSNFRSQCV